MKTKKYFPLSFIPTLYLVGLSVVRLIEIAQVPFDVPIDPIFPPWLIGYLWCLTLTLLIIGMAGLIFAYLRRRGMIKSPLFGRLIALVSLAVIFIHGWFSFQDGAVGAGGFIWGVIHIITLTRTYIPNGATEAGLWGYRLGQKFGIALLLIYPILILIDFKPSKNPDSL